ncbi:MAG: hypothetical protein ACYTHJ_16335 [Planctomycetota bacterium]|jgi:hypothetical protein
MITSLTDWLAFLRVSDAIIGLPLLLGGLALMVFGWRMWKACLVISFGLIGLGVGSYFGEGNPNQTFIAIGAGLLLGAVSYWPVNMSLAVLGGLIGSAFLMHTLEGMGLHGPVLWILSGTGLLGAGALAFINRQLVVIAVTAFEGSILLVSGIAAFVMTMPGLYGVFESHGAFVVPFGLLVPTVMSCFYQVAEVHRVNKSM